MADADPQAAPRTRPHPNCPLCARTGAIAHAALRDRANGVAGDWSFRACRRCSLGWLDPQPIDADIALCYPGGYYTHRPGQPARASAFGMPGLRGWVRDAILAGRYRYAVPGVGAGRRRLGVLLGRVAPLRYRLAYSRDHSLPVWRPGGRLLDIGCGSGSYLNLARSLGWQTYGLDPDPVAAALARQSGATVECATLDTARLADAPFDAVTAMHAIEHARDPQRFLRQALALLRPGGFFYLQTPNFASLMHSRYGADWFALEIPRHLCLLAVPALRRLLRGICAWQSLLVCSNPRRARREQEQTIAMRRTGSFEAKTAFSRRERVGMQAWSLLEALGNPLLHWGEEIEVVGIRA